MEDFIKGIFGLLLMGWFTYVAFTWVRAIFNALFKGTVKVAQTAKATTNAVSEISSGNKDVISGFKDEFNKIDAFEARAVKSSQVIDGESIPCVNIEVRGKIKVPKAGANCFFAVSAFDITDGESANVICTSDSFQEDRDRTFLFRTEPLDLSYGIHFEKWVQIAVSYDEILFLPHKGNRKLVYHVRVISSDNPMPIYHGYPADDSGIMYASATSESIILKSDIGYKDIADERDETEDLTVKLAFIISAADGSIDKTEALVINEWVRKVLEYVKYTTEYENRKSHLNSVLKNSFNEASKHLLNKTKITDRLNDIATNAEKFDAIELCLEVMSADGVAAPSEMQEINELSALLGIEPTRFRAMQDKHLSTIDTLTVNDDNLAHTVGVTADMNQSEIRKHLSKEYNKWNSRVSVSNGKEKAKAQEMLLHIADARKKYLD